MGPFSTEGARKRARQKALKEYEKGWNLRPAKDPPAALVDALQGEAVALRGVRWLTLAETRDDDGGPIGLLVGVRLDPKGPLTFAQAKERLEAAVSSVVILAVGLRFAELDEDVDRTMADEGANPYVIFERPG